MAIPALTANSPALGSISWAGFTVKYHGGTFSVAPGSTSKRFTWWRYNSAAQTVLATNLFTNPRATTTTRFTSSWPGTAPNAQSVAVSGELDASGGFAAKWTWSVKSAADGDVGPAIYGLTTAGTTYTIAYKIKAIEGGIIGGPSVYSSSGVNTVTARSRSGAKTFAAGEIEQQWVTFSSDATAVAAGNMKVYNTVTSTGAQSWEVFDVILVTGSTVPVYFDGNTPPAGTSTDAAWTGAVDASSSQQLSVTPIIEAGDYLPDGLSGSLLSNSSFELQDGPDPTTPAGWVRGGWVSHTTAMEAGVLLNYAAGARAVELFPGSQAGADIKTEVDIDVTPGSTMYLAADIKGSASAGGGTYLRAIRSDTGAVITSTGTLENQAVTTAWAHKSGSVVIPAGVTKIRVYALATAAGVGTTTKVYVKNFTLSTSALPAQLTPDDMFLFINKNGVPVNVQLTTVIDGSLIVNESILADSIGANQITSPKIIAGAIDATHIQAGIIESIHIKSNSISTNKLMIGSFDNLISDPTFSTPLSASGPWPVQAGWSKQAAGARDGGESLRCAAAAGDQIIYNDGLYFYPIDTVDTTTKTNTAFFLSTIAKSSAANNGGVVVGARWILANGSTTMSYVGSDQSGSAGAWTRYSGRVVAPNTAVGVQFFSGVLAALATGTVDFDYAGANRAGTGELIVDGTITGDKIMAGSIQATHIAAGVLEAGFVLTGRIQVGTSSWDTTEGLVARDSAGNPFLTIPVNGSTAADLRGYFTAKGLTVEDNANLYGLTQEFGTFRLANGISDPAIGAALSRSWASVLSDLATDSVVPANSARGFVEKIGDATQWVVARSFFGGGLRAYNKTTGVTDAFWFPNLGNFQPDGGITRVGSYYYVLGIDFDRASAWYVYKLDTDGVKVSEWAWSTAPSKRPAIGNDGTNIVIAWSHSAGNFIRTGTYNISTGALIGGYVDCTHSLGVAYDVGGVYSGSADFGAARIVIATLTGKPLVFNSTGVRQTSHEFPHAGGSSQYGLHWDGTRFRHLDGQGRFWDYDIGHISDSTIYGGYTWYDADVSSGSVVHETKVSPAVAYTWPARSRLTVSGQPAPDAAVTDPAKLDKANLVRIWAGASSSTMRLQPGGGTNSALPLNSTSLAIPTLDVGSAVAPTVSTFGSASTAPGTISAASNGFSINGASDGSVGTGTFRDSVAQVHDASQVAMSANVTKTVTGASALTGLSKTITSPGTTAIYEITIDADVTIGVAATQNNIRLVVDGGSVTGPILVTAGPLNMRVTGAKTWLVTGLAAGSHTFTAETYNSAAGGSATISQTHTVMTVKRVG